MSPKAGLNSQMTWEIKSQLAANKHEYTIRERSQKQGNLNKHAKKPWPKTVTCDETWSINALRRTADAAGGQRPLGLRLSLRPGGRWPVVWSREDAADAQGSWEMAGNGLPESALLNRSPRNKAVPTCKSGTNNRRLCSKNKIIVLAQMTLYLAQMTLFLA